MFLVIPNSFKITSLLPYACYLVKVSATSPAGRGEPSSILYIMTYAGVPQVHNTVVEPSLSHYSPRSVLLEWTIHPDILSTSYASTWVNVSSAASGPKPKEVTGSPVEVGELEPNTHYNISLTVKFEGGGFGPPVLLMTTTPEDAEHAPIAKSLYTLYMNPPYCSVWRTGSFVVGQSELESSVVMLPLSLLSLLSCLALLGSAADDLGSGSGSGSAAAPSSPPRNLEVSMVTATTALVSWDPPLSPNGVVVSYNISYQPSDGSLNSVDMAVGGGIESQVLTDLRPFTFYNVSVLASTGEGAGPTNNTQFLTEQTAPQAPNILQHFPVSSTALWLSWQLEGRVPGILSGFNVTYTTDSLATNRFMELGPSNESVVLEGLEVWTQYEVCVVASTVGGGPGNSSCVTLRTLSAGQSLSLLCLRQQEDYCLPPAAPEVAVRNVSLVPLCPPSLMVVWAPVEPSLLNGPAEESVYVIFWQEREGRGNGRAEVDYSDTTTSGLVTGLNVDTAYSVSVALANNNGSGPNSTAVEEENPSLWSEVTLDLVRTFLLVSWQPPSPSPSFLSFNFTLTISSANGDEIHSTHDTSITIADLIPGTNYDVTIRTDGGCGSGEPVAMTTTTLEALPGPPVISIATVSASSVAIQLKEPLMPNGVITGFMVECAGSGEVSVAESYYICSGLEADSAVSVRVRAVNGAGLGDLATINTSTACQSEEPKVEETAAQSVTVQISEGCYAETGVLVVVQEVGGEPRPLGSYSVEELVELTLEYSSGRQKRQATGVYIAANISRGMRSLFELGDGMKYGGYTNHPLMSDTKYRVGVVSMSDTASQPDTIVTSPDFTTRKAVGSTQPTQTDETGFPVVVAAAVGGGLLFLLLLTITIIIAIATLICCYRSRRGNLTLDMQGKGSTHSFERSASVRLSGRRGNKPADPVEEYRANYHTEALEAHPPVPVDGFVNKLLVMKTNDNQLFLGEFGSIEMNPQQPCSVAELPVNRGKNRYHNILPYDHSRVKLSHGKGHGDYINASYCSGFMKVQGFIATQGPLPETVPDFWRLVWEQNARTVVMLTNAQERLKTKCEVYWPREVGCSVVYGAIEVTLTDFTQLADYTIRSLTINKAGSGKEGREIKQFHFTSWPDHGVPQFATAMLAMVRRVMAFHSCETGPMVVHCSAGVGRTGTFIVIYSMIERMKANRRTVDVYGHVSLLRTQRNYMVQTEDQYFFIYEAVAEVIVCGDTEVTLDQLEEYVNDILAAKNRYVNVLPYESRRVILQYQRAQEGSDYINASFIDERSAKYWPADIGQSLSCGLYSVEMTLERRSEHYTYRDIVLVDTQTGRRRQVRHFHYLSWPEVGVPSSSVTLLDFLREVQKNFATLNTRSPITVHCSNGIGRTGVFIALHILLERMVTEGLVDVFQTIKNLRIQRPAMVQTLEQYQFCYTAALDYLETSDLANQLRTSTRSESHSLRAASNASELRSSRRSLNRNDSLRSSAKRSSRNLEISQVGNGVSTTVYGDSEATSTFSSTQQNLSVAKRASQEDPFQRVPQGNGGEGVPSASPLPPSLSSTPQLLPNLSQSSQDHPTLPPSSLLHSNTLPSRGGSSSLLQTHVAAGSASASQSSLGYSGVTAYPVSSFRGRDSGGQMSSQTSLEREIAALTMNINNSNSNDTSRVVNVYIEP
ncbi:Receptor-type tyrosine-protein phosphatase delta [Geodia barretti]|uniref:Receptor-type tyrosine-protein phosphatase delta n=1 Tax=Geodia barretti TaxID=519541 RepID=A0AA35RLK7_GEOBA|nr:Receptor-type tyrosine-protein phosphatase delta [Geodia barretti]